MLRFHGVCRICKRAVDPEKVYYSFDETSQGAYKIQECALSEVPENMKALVQCSNDCATKAAKRIIQGKKHLAQALTMFERR